MPKNATIIDTSTVTIANYKLGYEQPCMIIAEVGQAHDGSLGLAHAFIDAIANAGADAVKFQTHIADAESTQSEPWRIKFGYQDKSRYDYWKRIEFNEDQWKSLKNHADSRGLIFLSSPFSIEAVELLKRIGVPAWKIASGELNNWPMLERIAETGLPVLLSTGMNTLKEIDQSVRFFQEKGVQVVILQCTSEYPCVPEKIGLNMLPIFQSRYKSLIGLSDHSGIIFPAISAATLGAKVIELHITLSRDMFGPDVKASLTTDELRQLIIGVRFIEKIKQNPVNKDAIANELIPLKKIFTKSIVAREDLLKGTILEEKHLAVKKPGTGMPPDMLKSIIGYRLKKNRNKDELLYYEDIEAI